MVSLTLTNILYFIGIVILLFLIIKFIKNAFLAILFGALIIILILLLFL